jgi:SNF2 family DNA or RNA helicase
MRIEAYLTTKDKIEVNILGTSRERADEVRRAVSASRWAGRISDGFAYTYPLSVDKCHEMRGVWGTSLKVHKALSEWYKVAHRERVEQVKRTRATDAQLVRVPALYPKLNTWLKPDQRVTAEWVANAYRGGGLLADEVGTGKTVGVVAGIIEAGVTGPTLIMCPKISVRPVWLKELRQHTDVPVYACYGNRRKRQQALEQFLADPNEFKVLVVVAEMVRVKAHREKGRMVEMLGYEYPELFDVNWSCVVVDESHKILGSLDVVRGNLVGEGIKLLNFSPSSLRLAVSATPFGKGGRTEALFGTLHWLWPDEFTSRWAWLRKYFEVNEERVFIRGGRGATKMVQKVGDVLNEDALWADLGPRVLRRTMEEVSPEHRGLKNFIDVTCEMTPGQARQYKTFAQDAELMVEGGLLSTVGVLDYLTRTRQMANGVLRMEGGRVVYTGESGKLDKLMHHLSNLAPNRKVVIASQFNEYLDVVEKRLEEAGFGSYRLDGRTTEKRRQDIMEAFQGTAPGYNIFLLNSQAGGVSITLDAADELHELDEMFPPEANEQLFGRIFRRGRVHEVFFYLYRSEGTIDEVNGEKIMAGQQKQARLMDGRRGLEYVRQLAKYNPPKE